VKTENANVGMERNAGTIGYTIFFVDDEIIPLMQLYDL
jgi:hypothetical protein